MIVQKTDPVGVDAEIDRYQSKMYSYLTEKVGWGIYTSYPRAYKNTKSGGTIPEVYTGKKNYKEVLLNNKINVNSFFLVEDSRDYDNENGRFEQGISIIFQSNLKKLYPAILHRADEEMHKDIFNAIKHTFKSFTLDEFITGVENVYSDLDIPSENIERVKLDDMSYYHVVKIDLTIPYQYCK